MRIEIRKYGDLLVSRPAGREAAAAMLAYLPEVGPEEPIELDFDGVLVVAPSWLDEVLQGLRERFGDRVRCLASKNESLAASLAVLTET
ncbi:MAG: STAS-like domain-containing protein [Deltaproteobacteria bacterium]|nr:STAS-like domain-containing protein [Deltaproteobacteria bacterium]